MERSLFVEWYTDAKRTYERLAAHVRDELEKALQVRKVDFAKTEFRVKDINSAADKSQRKIINANAKDNCVLKYNSPKNQIIDYAGVRVVVYLTSDVKTVDEIIKDLFNSDKSHYSEKITEMGKDKVGYLSVHYVVSLFDDLTDKAAYADFKGLKCEIQVRTVLQHAWAQIFHDRQYKFSGDVELPPQLLRETNLIAGNLELSDGLITNVVRQYDSVLCRPDNAAFQKLLDESINDKNLSDYIKQKFSLQNKLRYIDSNKVFNALQVYDIKLVRHLDAIIKEDFLNKFRTSPSCMVTIDRLVTCLLIASDHERYFSRCGENIRYISDEAYSFLDGLVDIKTVCEANNLRRRDEVQSRTA